MSNLSFLSRSCENDSSHFNLSMHAFEKLAQFLSSTSGITWNHKTVQLCFPSCMRYLWPYFDWCFQFFTWVLGFCPNSPPSPLIKTVIELIEYEKKKDLRDIQDKIIDS